MQRWNLPKNCRDPGSNRGPLDLQSNALPTELSRQLMVQLDFDGSCVDSKFQTPGRSWTLWLLLALLAPRRMLQTTEITKNTDCCCFDFHRSESRRQISRAKAAAATGFIDPSKILLWLHLDNFRLGTINQFWVDDPSTKSTTNQMTYCLGKSLKMSHFKQCGEQQSFQKKVISKFGAKNEQLKLSKFS